MDWPISWQKVKDSGAVVFDIADYGLRLDPINPVVTDNVAIMYDVENALNDGKTVYLKSDITSMGFNGYAVLPITMYTFSNGLGDKLARICAAGLVPNPSMTTPSFLLAVNFLGRYGSESKLSTVTMTTHRFVEEGSDSGSETSIIDMTGHPFTPSANQFDIFDKDIVDAIKEKYNNGECTIIKFVVSDSDTDMTNAKYITAMFDLVDDAINHIQGYRYYSYGGELVKVLLNGRGLWAEHAYNV